MATVSKKVTSKDQPANTEAVAQRCSVKKVFLEISQNSQVFSCEFFEISKNIFSCRTPLVASSGVKYASIAIVEKVIHQIVSCKYLT